MLTVRSPASGARRSSTGCRTSQRPDWPKTSRARNIAYWNSSDRGDQPLKPSGAILVMPAQWTRWCGNPARVSEKGRTLWFGRLDWNVTRAINERGGFPVNGYDRHGCLDPRGGCARPMLVAFSAALRLTSDTCQFGESRLRILDFCASLSDRSCIPSVGAQNVELNFAVVHIISESL